MYDKDKLKLMWELPVQAVCSLYAYLFLTVKGHDATCQIVRNLRVQQLEASRAAKPSLKVSSKHAAQQSLLSDREQEFKSQIGRNPVINPTFSQT